MKADNVRRVLAVSLIPVRGGPTAYTHQSVSQITPLLRFKLILTSFRQIDSFNRISELVCTDTDIEAQYMMYCAILISYVT